MENIAIKPIAHRGADQTGVFFKKRKQINGLVKRLKAQMVVNS